MKEKNQTGPTGRLARTGLVLTLIIGAFRAGRTLQIEAPTALSRAEVPGLLWPNPPTLEPFR